ncbi:unnamed protein product [Urochloa humidicola]
MAGGSDDKAGRRRTPWTVRIQLAALALGHRRDGSIRRLLFSIGDLESGAPPTSPSTPPVASGRASSPRHRRRQTRPRPPTSRSPCHTQDYGATNTSSI